MIKTGGNLRERYMRMMWWLNRHPVHRVYLLYGVTLAPHQRICFRESLSARNVIFKLSRGMSKSFMDGLILVDTATMIKGATQIVLTSGFRGGKIIIQEYCERIILGTLDGQVQKNYVLRSLDSYKKTPRSNVTRIIRRDPDLWKILWSHGSNVQTGPLGKDVSRTSSLRGVRANKTIILDESADIPEDLYTSVIIPFGRVAINPVLGIKQKPDSRRKLTKIESGTVRYDWQRYTREIEITLKNMLAGDKGFIVLEFNYEDSFHLINNKQSVEGARNLREELKRKNLVPTYMLNLESIQDEIDNPETPQEEFLAENKNIVIEALGTEFSTELMLSVVGQEIDPAYVDDGDSDEDSIYYNPNKFDRWLRPLTTCNDPCVLGIDPARERDDAAFVLIRIGSLRKCEAPFNDVINAKTFHKAEFSVLRDVVYDYYLARFPNIRLIVMDQGGGGLAVRDLLWRPTIPGALPIFDPSDEYTPEEVRDFGLGILRMSQATPETNTFRANYAKAQLQSSKLQFPPFELHTGNKEMDEQNRTIRRVWQQFTYVTSAPAGHWKKYTVDSKHKKDLFSATLLALQGIYDILNGVEQEYKPVEEYAWLS